MGDLSSVLTWHPSPNAAVAAERRIARNDVWVELSISVNVSVGDGD